MTPPMMNRKRIAVQSFTMQLPGRPGRLQPRFNARTLVLIHTSSRYTDAQAHINDAKTTFAGPILAPDDLDMIEVPFQGLISPFLAHDWLYNKYILPAGLPLMIIQRSTNIA